MKNGRRMIAGLMGSAVLGLGVAVVACSTSTTTAVGGDGGAGGGPDGTTGGGSKSCTTDSQCTPPATTPVNCASGKCDSVSGTCTFKANDADGDGHPAANCKATNGVVVQEGDDCDDSDPNLYPAHPEACTMGDGGVTRWPHGGAIGACKTGQLTCQAGGGISACTGEVPACPANETCIGGACTGQCGPGETQCSGNNALQTCEANGTWGMPVTCMGGACLEGEAGTGTASCGGSCTPGTTECQPGANAVQTCSQSGAWGTPAACPATSTCLQVQADAGTVASCGGTCGPNNTTCNGNSVVTCQASGGYDGGTAVPCTGTTPACLSGACVACTPGDTRCGTGAQANYVQTCDVTGTWTTAAHPCTDVCSAGQCGGNCVPGQTECGSNNNVLTCPTSGTWPTSGGELCTNETKTCVQTGTSGNPSASCQGSCVSGTPAACGPCGKGTETCTTSGNPGTCSGDVPQSAPCGVSPACQNGTSTCGGACVGDTTDYGASCGNCGHGTVKCGGGCTESLNPSESGNGCGGGTCGADVTLTIDLNKNFCANGQIFAAWTWYPTYTGYTNPNGTYTANYTLSNHNNMSTATTPAFWVGCDNAPMQQSWSESVLADGTLDGQVTCSVGHGVVVYPVACGQSGSCCGDPSVVLTMTGWTSQNATCNG